MSVSRSLQKAIFSTLADIPDVKVYDYVPETAKFPFIKIGDDSFASDSGFMYGTADIEIYSSEKGFQQVKDLTETVIDKLEALDYSDEDHNVTFLNTEGFSFDRATEDIRVATITVRFIVA